MNIFVLIKRTFDSEEKITIHAGDIVQDGAEFIINPYDEFAIEEAIRMKEAHGGEITVMTVGSKEASRELRTALAMGCDKAVLFNIEEDVMDPDPFTTATILYHYITEKPFELILAGNATIDSGSGQVGPRLAELLNIPCVTTITKLAIDGKEVEMERDAEGNIEIVKSQLPLLLTTQQGLNEPRYPSLPGIIKAKKKPMEELTLNDLNLTAEEVAAKTKTTCRLLPPKKAAVRMIEGDAGEQAKQLAALLRSDAKVI
ncbi:MULTISPECIES: electron transfer flavoprotein subunit beta/FixA family protein [Bacillus]|uniref:Electron transfer flavoprotein subunit beta n=2 Tax=Bacillus TaxID=1386 RepID=A0A0M5JBN5_9BACI|nr:MULTISPECIES: electron transfer flavoprotein subunit beta/FixA family protein [Bacillus]ALC81907.1 electron transfer flavoprotein subunit beta [Bacillus gobiensis]MBP1083224.1 electron transfer flavoprotein beta subunit [Bacillus capparidis]MED1097665.1 electron transfer flavoprotein subunit beta/FixA family protein [Bacillus capparidis]